MTQKKTISCVVPAFNEEKYLGATLQSIKRQTYQPKEIIVVPNACTDNTEKIARAYTDMVFPTKIQGISHAKNIGAIKATGDILVFCDADSLMADDLLEHIATCIDNGFNCGKALVLPRDDFRLRARIFCMYLNKISYIMSHTRFSNGTGSLIFLTKDLYNQMVKIHPELFSEKLQVLEDVEFLMRVKKVGNFAFIQKSHILWSMRRFKEEGYLKWLILDNYHRLNPDGKTRKRWRQDLT